MYLKVSLKFDSEEDCYIAKCEALQAETRGHTLDAAFSNMEDLVRLKLRENFMFTGSIELSSCIDSARGVILAEPQPNRKLTEFYKTEIQSFGEPEKR